MQFLELPPLEVLRRYFRIDAHGRLERRTQRYGWRLAARIGKGGKYFTLGFEGKKHFAHRIIWALANDRLPTGIIDHINGQPWDNRPENLREATHAQNRWNCAPYAPNAHGFPNVYRDSRGFHARVVVDYETIRSPSFDDAELAGLAAQELKRRHHGDFVREAA